MDAKKFGVKSPGELVALDEKDHAFLPHPLPPNWSFPVSLWPMLGEAKAKLALLEGVGRTLPSPKILLQPLASREAIQSSRLEGTYASPSELLLYELEQKEDEPTERRVQDWKEVFNYRKALDHGMTSELPLSLRLIRDMHRTLMAGVRGKDKAPGDFRRIQVAVGATRRFIPPPADRVPGCIVECLFHSPFVRIAEVARLLEVTYPTAKADVKRLCDAGILRELPQLHPRTYVAQEVFDAAYADIEAM